MKTQNFDITLKDYRFRGVVSHRDEISDIEKVCRIILEEIQNKYALPCDMCHCGMFYNNQEVSSCFVGNFRIDDVSPVSGEHRIMMWRCRCGKENTSNFCTLCGLKNKTQESVCFRCGKKTNSQAVFCGFCGNKLNFCLTKGK
ncbi:MAG: hypothetical protein IJO74_01965 [Clostridia bacterium]|nr:hypothetical protein [Clostridia bacterium]